MKKIVCLLLVVFGGLLANPIVPIYKFSELLFPTEDEWELEIYTELENMYSQVDSVIISSNSSSSKIETSVFANSTSRYFVIQNNPQCLLKPLNIDCSGDSITIFTFFKEGYGYTDADNFKFGEGTCWPLTYTNMSIAKMLHTELFHGWHVKIGTGYDQTPNIGVANDSSGAIGMLTGKVLDKYNNPICNQTFMTCDFMIPFIWPQSLTTNSDGIYRIRTLSKDFFLKNLYNNLGTIPLIDPKKVMIMPDSTSHCDFILDMVGINEQPATTKSSALLYNYPNPFNNQTAIYYEVPEGVKYKNATIRISNIKGEAVAVLAANQKSGSVYWNADHNSAGMYIYQLLIDGKAVKSGEMVLLK